MLSGGALLLFSLFNRHIIQFAFPTGSDEPVPLRGTLQDLKRIDGTKIHIETFGPSDGPTLVLTHGWSMNGTEWYYSTRHLANRFKLICVGSSWIGTCDDVAKLVAMFCSLVE